MRGNWPLFGHYGNARRLQDLGGFRLYFDRFAGAVESLVAARFLRRPEADKMFRNAQLDDRSSTFTRNYREGLFV